ncbi:MAG TPA: hypothetical protein DHW82_04960 [Spirochaetia bacterium]|nr:MAG: hypothetical protein A2Y41_13205 [Spirochaetes bacterium GWB1_36_13]HCL56342.1 hypothetical protein [Spirochaetia bacterium]
MGTLFLAATFFEARALLVQNDFIKLKRNLFKRGNDFLFITGIGKSNVIKSLEIFEEMVPEKIVNFGIAGAVSPLEIGSSFIPQQVLSELMLQSNIILKENVLITVELPVSDFSDFRREKRLSDFQDAIFAVDMEAYWISCYSEMFYDLHPVFLKIISDYGSIDFQSQFSNRKEILLKNLSELLFCNI